MENLEKAVAEIKNLFPELKLLENENLSAHSSFKIGGPAGAMAFPKSEAEFIMLCAHLRKFNILPMLLGKGSNVLFPDEGLKAAFIISTELLNELSLSPDGLVSAGAGVSLARLAAFAAQNSLSGLEFAAGIPGSTGGSCVMNAGAFGGELKDCIESVCCYDLKKQELHELTNQECLFRYRGSLFKETEDYAVLSAKFRLKKGDSSEILEKMRSFGQSRRDKQPLDFPSAGSTFKRPDGCFAAALIDEAGLKGHAVGGAQVSPKHAGFVVNTGNATAADVRELISIIQGKVLETSGIKLEPEVVIIDRDFRKEC